MVAHTIRVAYLHVVHASHSHDAHGLAVDPLGLSIYDMVVDYFSMPELIPGKLILLAVCHIERVVVRWLDGD